MQPSFSGLLVTCAYLPHTTLPPGVTSPSSLTFTCAEEYPGLNAVHPCYAELQSLPACKPSGSAGRAHGIKSCMHASCVLIGVAKHALCAVRASTRACMLPVFARVHEGRLDAWMHACMRGPR